MSDLGNLGMITAGQAQQPNLLQPETPLTPTQFIYPDPEDVNSLPFY